MSFSINRMSSFTEFATKLNWCECSLNNGIMGSNHRDNYVSGWDKKIMNSVYS